MDQRRSSILDSLKSPLMTSNDLSFMSMGPFINSNHNNNNNNNNMNSGNANMNSNISNNNMNNTSSGNTSNDPFQLSSIWSSPGSRRASDIQNYTTWSNNDEWESPRRYSLDSFETYPNESTPQLIQYYKALDFYFNTDPYNRVSMNIDALDNTSIEALIDGSINLPKFPNNSQLPSQELFLISFKSGRIDCFYLPDSSSLNLKIGDLVIVEADRGKDLGKVVKLNLSIDEFRLLKYLQFIEQQAAVNSFESTSSSLSSNNGSNNSIPTLHFPKPILRLALSQEILQLTTKLQDEEKAKKICQFKLESSPLITSRDSVEPSSLPATPQTSLASSMSIVDAEYQFDRKKLIFYYKANHRIDFRDLVRDLFRIYKTRIWMCAVNSNKIIESPSIEKTHLFKLNNIEVTNLFNNQLNNHHYQNNNNEYHYENSSDFTGFNQNIWTSSSPSLTPQSASNNYYGYNYNLPSSQSTSNNQNSIYGVLNENQFKIDSGFGQTRSGSIWN